MEIRHLAILNNPNIPWTEEGINAWWERANAKLQAAFHKRLRKIEKGKKPKWRSPKATLRGGIHWGEFSAMIVLPK